MVNHSVHLLHSHVVRRKHTEKCVSFIILLGFGLVLLKKKKHKKKTLITGYPQKLSLVLFQLDINIVA